MTARLSVRDLEKHYPVREGLLGRQTGVVRAVDGISFDVSRGEAFGLVGESGCGKSTTALTILGLEEPTGGDIRFDGTDVTDDDDATYRRRVAMVFQDPEAAFDPRMTIGESVAEPLAIHGLDDAGRRREVVRDLLPRVGLDPDDVDRYPHELSGGQKQRAALARALVVNPDVLIADEPVSALDVSVQSRILELISDLQRELDLSLILISHDLGVVRQVCDRIAVMYLGEIVETADTKDLFEDPKHPYTEALLASMPTPDPERDAGVELTGDVPDPIDPPDGCRFHPRCPEVIPPEDYDVDRDTWRALLDLQIGLREGETTGTPGELRAEYDLPAELADPDAEAVLEDALASAASDPHAAAERLVEAFATPCRARVPETREIEPGHETACHLYEESDASTDP